jgi:hypothetical protein
MLDKKTFGQRVKSHHLVSGSKVIAKQPGLDSAMLQRRSASR